MKTDGRDCRVGYCRKRLMDGHEWHADFSAINRQTQNQDVDVHSVVTLDEAKAICGRWNNTHWKNGARGWYYYPVWLYTDGYHRLHILPIDTDPSLKSISLREANAA